MKNYFRIILLIIILASTVTLIACSKVNAESDNITPQEITQPLEINQYSQQELIVDIDTILEYRDGFKEKEFPSIEEIGEENLAGFLFQQFNHELCYELGTCFCHF